MRAAYLFAILAWGLLFSATVGCASAAESSVYLQTGGAAQAGLVSTNLLLQIDPSNSTPVLNVDFWFGTEEPPTPGQLLDSAALTIQTTNGTSPALLLSADSWGMHWLPPTPGALSLAASNLTVRAVTAPASGTNWVRQFHYLVSWLLPAELVQSLVRIYLDLLDNGNALGSSVALQRITVTSQEAPIDGPELVLQSSASPGGPFADEKTAEIDASRKTIRLAKARSLRFYRLRVDSEARIGSWRDIGKNLTFSYQFPDPVVVLQYAEKITGPFMDAPGAKVNLTQRTISFARPAKTFFYRARSNVRVNLSGPVLNGADLEFAFEYNPTILSVQSACEARGPYADESGAAIDTKGQIIRVAQEGAARFYRLKSRSSHRLAHLEFSDGNLLIIYQ